MRMIVFLQVLFLVSLQNELSAQGRSHLTADSIPPHNYFAFRFEAGVLLEKPFTTLTGNYQLESKPQGSFSGGLIYQLNMNRRWNMSYGLLLNVVSTNYFLHIPDSDMKGFPSSEGAPQIWDKEVYYNASLPVFLSYNFLLSKGGFYGLHLGGKLHYSGGGTDMSTFMLVQDSSGNMENVFNGHFIYNKSVWLSYTAGISRTVGLKNHGMISFGVFGEFSGASFISGDYQITVPYEPVATGEYNLKTSSVGISAQYYFPQKRARH